MSFLALFLTLLLVLPTLLLYIIIKKQKYFLYAPFINHKGRLNLSSFRLKASKPTDDNLTDKYAHYTSPGAFHLEFKEFLIKTVDRKTLHSWFIYSLTRSQERPTLVVFHGNAGHMGLRLPYINALVRKVGVNVFIVDYRGYGLSTGEPSEQGLLRDASAALRFLTLDYNHSKHVEHNGLQIDTTKIFLHGISLGGAVAIGAASIYDSYKIKGLIIQNTFLSVPYVLEARLERLNIFSGFNGRNRLRKIFKVIKYFLKLSWNSNARIHMIPDCVPVLFLSSRRDKIVPPRHMDRLFQNLLESKKVKKDSACWKLSQLRMFPKGEHNNCWIQPGYFEAIEDFITNIAFLILCALVDFSISRVFIK
eukprot:snap_masked-scaffold_1-processed-gene-29.32-mRNA-1 protein AED:1.00 eAED:1.00 QI:0/0/0/0/1/1/2/0/363